jgi:NAD(P)-dependent dehydrogenase (short-subunit alcohol dehydrogenase family)
MTKAGFTERDIPDQTGKRFLITGANSGLGLETARMLAQHGGDVILACRNPQRGEEAVEIVRATAKGQVELVSFDLASLASVEVCAADLTKRFDRLDGVFANAGLMAIPEGKTVDGFEMTFGTNHLGHFALVGRLFPLLLATPNARVITTSSSLEARGTLSKDDPFGEKRRYDRWRVYADSKLANLIFVKELARRAARAGLSLSSLGAHPGYAATELQGKGTAMGGSRLQGLVMSIGNRYFAQSQADGALPQVCAGTREHVPNGGYFGPASFGGIRGPAVEVKPMNRRVRDEELAALLWDESERRTHVVYPFPTS